MKLVVASDEKTNLTDSVIEYIGNKGHELFLLGDLVNKKNKWRWAEIGREHGRFGFAEPTQVKVVAL